MRREHALSEEGGEAERWRCTPRRRWRHRPAPPATRRAPPLARFPGTEMPGREAMRSSNERPGAWRGGRGDAVRASVSHSRGSAASPAPRPHGRRGGTWSANPRPTQGPLVHQKETAIMRTRSLLTALLSVALSFGGVARAKETIKVGILHSLSGTM